MKERAKQRVARAHSKSVDSTREVVVAPIKVATASGQWKGHRTANKTIVLLRTVLASAGRKADNPAESVSRFKQAPRRRRLSDEEAIRFRKAWKASRKHRAIFHALSAHGQATPEPAAMRWADVDLERARWLSSGRAANGDLK